MPGHWLTKRIFLEGYVCPRRGWLLDHAERRDATPTLGQQFRLIQGNEIGELARGLFAPGLDLRGPATDALVEQGRRAVSDPGVRTAFELPVVAGHAIARPDILLRDGEAWRVIEVKSAKSVRSELIDDLAYTVAVLQGAGLGVAGAELALVNAEWRADNAEPALKRHDVTDDALDRAAVFGPLLETVHGAVSSPETPAEVLASVCRGCEFRGTRCFVDGPRHPVFELPGVRSKKVDAWIADGITSIGQLPDDAKLTPIQQFHRRAVLAGNLVTEAAALERVRRVAGPVAYLDFETVSLALPPVPGLAPYDVVPIQFSVHRRDGARGLAHADLLLDPAAPDLEAFARTLLEVLDGAPAIVVYSSFEKQRLKWLAGRLPAMAADLEHAIGRLVDLYPLVQAAVAHPDFHGSLSIKQVLPVFVPESELSYHGLEIAKGDDAAGVAGLRAMGRIGDAEWERYRGQLLAYCAVDTLAMVRLHDALAALTA
jgi:predicted RecB family nuclease